MEFLCRVGKTVYMSGIVIHFFKHIKENAKDIYFLWAGTLRSQLELHRLYCLPYIAVETSNTASF